MRREAMGEEEGGGERERSREAEDDLEGDGEQT